MYLPHDEEWDGGRCFWLATENNKNAGVGVVVTNSDIVMNSFEILTPGRAVACTFTYLGNKFKLINGYAPAKKEERNSFLKELSTYLVGRGDTILAGDFILSGMLKRGREGRRRSWTCQGQVGF